MNEYNYKTYDYYTSNTHDNTIHSLNRNELDNNVVNEEQFSKTRNNVSNPTTRLRNKYATWFTLNYILCIIKHMRNLL